MRGAGFCHEQALILYVYLQDGDGEGDSVLTVRKHCATISLICQRTLTDEFSVLHIFL